MISKSVPNVFSGVHPTIPNLVAEEIRVCGIVQGVGFRPTVYRIAQSCELRGEVWNDGQGVFIRAVGTAAALSVFVDRLQQECPPLATITAIQRTPLLPLPDYSNFTITASVSNTIRTGITPDAATCPQCQAETFDPASRWYRYPFTNCTHCGPRLSIVRSIPYDRVNTSMAAFVLCPDCAKNYGDVTDRRFHAQPVACPRCGPHVWLERSNGQAVGLEETAGRDAIEQVRTLLQQGKIVAIKGLGGFQLACDATQEQAVATLRQRKHRYHKPLALMARDLEVIDRYCWINTSERQLLCSPAAPIVLLSRKPDSFAPAIAPSVAPGRPCLGFLLPYTPLHHLLLHELDCPIVFTSGNISDEPQCIDNAEAMDKLGQIADYVLLHDRQIVNRVDDSVVRGVATTGVATTGVATTADTTNSPPPMQMLRRARGYAPAPLNLPPGFEQAPPLLAMGSELKNTFCLVQDGKAILSQHLGDLENRVAFQAYQETLQRYLHLFQHQPVALAVDLHPEYLSTKLGQELRQNMTAAHPATEPATDCLLYPVQHHHAHVAACLAENQIPLSTAPVLGIALDGLGYGTDGTLWGGEFLLADYNGFRRLACLKPIAMLGGEQAIYQPWRNTYAHLMAAANWADLDSRYGNLELMQFLQKQPRSLLNQMLAQGINAPLASSAGRLFDAVAAALGICREQATYEGQGAIELEALVDEAQLHLAATSPYPFEWGSLHQGGNHRGREEQTDRNSFPIALSYLEPRPMWLSLLKDVLHQIPQPLIAARFHLGLAQAIGQQVSQLQQQHSFTQVALTGGVFQNLILTQLVTQEIDRLGLTVLTHHQIPPNDGGLSLGQAAIAAAQLLHTSSSPTTDSLVHSSPF